MKTMKTEENKNSLNRKYHSHRKAKHRFIRQFIASLLIMIMCVNGMDLQALAFDDEHSVAGNTVTAEVPMEITETESLEDFTNEISDVLSEDDLDSDNTYASKRLIVVSNNADFSTEQASSVISWDGVFVLSYDSISECKKAYKALKKDKTIISVEVDKVLEPESQDTKNKVAEVTSNESKLKKHLDSLENKNKVTVAILDTGIDTCEFDNVIDTGFNLSSTGEKDSIEDDNGHGTEIATIINEFNEESIKLMPIKIANSEGKATVLSAYVAICNAVEYGAKVINISMNADSSSDLLAKAIDEATAKGVHVIVSAGNNGKATDSIVPANVDSAIVVSAVDSEKNLASYSNYGDTVDYCAFGDYAGKSGTSYAAARVSAIIANLLIKDQPLEVLDNYAEDLGEEGFDQYYGKGFISLGDVDEKKEDATPDTPKEVTSSTPGESEEHDHSGCEDGACTDEKLLAELINSQNPAADVLETQVSYEDATVYTVDSDFDVRKDFYHISYNPDCFKIEYVSSTPLFNLNKPGKYEVTYKASTLPSYGDYHFEFKRNIMVERPQLIIPEGANVIDEEDLSTSESTQTLSISSDEIDITNMTKGAILGHTCVPVDEWDADEHWKVCNICGEEIEGSRFTHCYKVNPQDPLPDSSHAECHYTNNYTALCVCGSSSSVPRKEHGTINKNQHSGTQFAHFASCSDCGTWVGIDEYGGSSSQACKHNGVIINCQTPASERTCDVCGNTHMYKGHWLELNRLNGNTDSSLVGDGNLSCDLCGKTILHATSTGVVYSNNYSSFALDYAIAPIAGVTLKSFSNIWCSSGDGNIHKNITTTAWWEGSNIRWRIGGDLADSPYGTLRRLQYRGALRTIENGMELVNTLSSHNYDIYKDHTPPTVNIPTVVRTHEENGWAHGVEITVTGAEAVTNYVNVELQDGDGVSLGTKKVQVTNGTFSTTFTPKYESTADHGYLKVIVSDLYGNENPQNYDLYDLRKVDAALPSNVMFTIDNSNWTQTRDLTVAATDKGSGDLQFNFNNNGWEDYDTKAGNVYTKKFTLTGNAIPDKTLAVYIKDASGNITTKYITISKLDGKNPIISSADTTVNGTSATITVNATDEGSGLSQYAITTATTAPSSGWQSSNKFTKTKSGTYYAWAKDAVGNISNKKTFTINLEHKLTIDPNGGSMYKGTELTSESFTIPVLYGRKTILNELSPEGYFRYNYLYGLPIRTGYTFDGWSYNHGSGGVSDGEETIYFSNGSYITDKEYVYNGDYDGDVTVTAQWVPNTHKITIDPNGGEFYTPDSQTTKVSTAWSKEFTYGTTSCFAHDYELRCDTNLNAVSQPTRLGYEFKGWKRTAGGGTVTKDGIYNTFNSDYDGDVTFKAQWEQTFATVTCKDVVGSTSGTSLGSSTWSAQIGTTAYGSSAGTSTMVGTYYTGYQYESCTSATVGSSGATVYRIFKEVPLNVTASGYTGTYDGQAHGISVSCSGATIRFSTTASNYTLTSSPTYTNVGTYTVYYQVSKSGYKTVTGSKTVTISRAANTLKLSASSGTVTYPVYGSFTIDTNKSGGALTITNSNNNAISLGVSGNKVTIKPKAISADTTSTITITSAQTTNYNSATVTYTVSVKQGKINVTTTDYAGTYDGRNHSMTIKTSYTALDSSNNAKTISATNEANGIITYWTSENSTKVKTNPTFKDSSVTPYTAAGKYVVYYEVAKAGYKTVTGQAYVTINRANGKVEIDSNSSVIKYGEDVSFNVTKNVGGGTISAPHNDTNVCDVAHDDNDGGSLANPAGHTCDKPVISTSVSGNKITLKGTHTGTSKISVTSAQTRNYKAAVVIYDVEVKKADNQMEQKIVKPLQTSTISGQMSFNSLELESGIGFNSDASNTTEATKTSGLSKAKRNVNTTQSTYLAARASAVSATADIELTYPNRTSLAVTENISGGEITSRSSDEAIATTWVEGNVVHIQSGTKAGLATIYVTTAATENFNSLTTSFTVKVSKGSLYVETEPYYGAYTGTGHGINLTTIDGATVTYSTDFDGDYVEEEPLYTRVGEYTTFYRVEKDGYYTVTGSETITIIQASSRLSLASYSGTVSYPNKLSTDISTKSDGALTVSSSNSQIATAKITEDNKLEITPGTIEGVATITLHSAATESFKSAAVEFEVTVAKGDLDVAAQGYTGDYDNSLHSISVTSQQSGASITYSASENGPFTSKNPEYRDVGTYRTYYKIIAEGYKTFTGYEDIEINPAENTLELSATSGNLTYPGDTTVEVLTNVSRGALSVASSDTDVATASLDGTSIKITAGTKGGNATITVISEATSNYKRGTATYDVSVAKGTLTVTARGYTGDYDGDEHSITVSSSEGTTITYSTELEGSYTMSNPQFSDAGNYTVFYRVEKAGYEPVQGSETVKIAKVTNTITVDSETCELTYPTAANALVTKNVSGGNLTVSSSNEDIVTAEMQGNKLVIQPQPILADGSATLTLTSAETTNYLGATKTITVNVAQGTLNLEVTGYNDHYDGELHSISVTSPEGADISFSDYVQSVSPETPIEYNRATPPEKDEVGVYTIYYKAEKPGYKTVYGKEIMTIRKAALPEDTIPSFENSFTYDGNPHGLDITYPGATIKYGTDSNCNLDISPTYKDAGEYTIYYTISHPTYDVYHGVATIVIAKSDVEEQFEFDVIGSTEGVPVTPETPVTADVPSPIEVTSGTPQTPDVLDTSASHVFTYDGTAKKIDVALKGALSGAGQIAYKFYDLVRNVWLDYAPKIVGVYQEWVYFMEGTNNKASKMHYATTFAINPAEPSISAAEDTIEVTYGDAPFALDVSTDSDSDIAYSIYEGDSVKVSTSGVVTIKKTGTTKIKVAVSATENYTAAEPIYVTIKVNPLVLDEDTLDKLLDIKIPSNVVYDGTAKSVEVVTKDDSVGDVTIYYELPDGTLSTTAPTNPGNYNVYVTITGGDNVSATEQPVKVGSMEIEQSVIDSIDEDAIKDIKIPTEVKPGDDITIILPPELVSIATIAYKKVGTEHYLLETPSKPGSYEVWLRVLGDSAHVSNVPDRKLGVFTINKYSPELKVTTTNYSKECGDADFNLAGVTSKSDNPVIYTVVEGTDVISLKGTTVHVIKAGSATIKLSVAESDLYHGDEAEITVEVAKIPELPEEVLPTEKELSMELSPDGLTTDDIDLSRWPGWEIAPEDKGKELVPGTTTDIKLTYTGEGHENYENTVTNITITLPPCEHQWDEGFMFRTPTTEEDGLWQYTCHVCGSHRYRLIPKLTGDASVTPEPSPSVTVEPSPSASPSPTPEVTKPITPDTPSVTAVPTDVVKPTVTDKPNTPTAKPTAVPTKPVDNYVKAGTVVKIGKAYYKVTKDIYHGSTVEYKKPTSTKIKSVSIPSTVKIKGVTYKVTSVGASAFSKCKKLKTAKMGKYVKTIQSKAFYNCKALTKVTIGAGVTNVKGKAFANCTSLKSITIPKNVTSLGAEVFSKCKKLKKITIKSSKLNSKKVNKKAFKGVYSKVTIKVPKKKLSASKKMLKTKGLPKTAKVTK